ncbi:MAG: DUF2092 domain-containing protein [Bauldia sp.]|nr:DUF2092 domain-containing protein [Bauldia sp.]
MAVAGFGVAPASADDGQARELLKEMSDYLAAQQVISFTYDSDIEVVTTDLQKLDFASTGTVSLSRPDKLRATRTGGFVDMEMVFDGKTFSVLGKDMDSYTQVEIPGSVDELVDRLRIDYGIAAPGADLLLSDVYDALMDNVIDVKDLGSGVVAGVECNHLAFRTEGVDWEIWIAMGDAPYPCRYSVTSKLVTLGPQYRVAFRDWKTGADVAKDDFGFDPGSAVEVDIAELGDVDGIPDLTPEGEDQ